jgi:transposase InsO family protein
VRTSRLNARRNAIRTRHPAPETIFHSDRRVEYLAAEHRRVMAQQGLIQSMNRRAA